MTSSVSARRSRASRSRRSWWMWLCLTLAPLPFSAIHAQTRSTTACPSGSHADSALSVAARRVDVQPNVPARCLAVPVIDSATPGGHTARTLSDELQGRVAGVTVLESSGIVATGARVRFRGGIGLTLPREPLLVIDGVRVDASQSSPGIDVGGQRPSRLDDIPLDDIDRIAILRGPAASALYGVDAAGGVIEVRTKTGRPAPLGGARMWKLVHPPTLRAIRATGPRAPPALTRARARGQCRASARLGRYRAGTHSSARVRSTPHPHSGVQQTSRAASTDSATSQVGRVAPSRACLSPMRRGATACARTLMRNR